MLVLFFALFIQIFGQSQFIPIPTPSCPFSYGQSSSLFTTEPKPQNLQVCKSAVSNLACCTPLFEDTVRNASDTFSAYLQTFLSDRSPACTTELNSLPCIPCMYDSSTWSKYLTGTQFKVNLCSSFCDRLYQSCSSATVVRDNSPVSTAFPLPELFCNSLFGPTVVVNVRQNSEHNCYDPLTKDCTANDITYTYTECISGTRDLLYGWRADSNCTGGVSLSQSVSDLPCPIRCPKGSYLPLGTDSCSICPSGTYSIGGGYRVDTWDAWPSRPTTFHTYCTNSAGVRLNATSCSGWSLNGSFIESAIAKLSSTISVLETTVELRADGTVSFLCKIDSEVGFDKLYFGIDGNFEWIKNTINPALITYNLTSGVHQLTWKYSKDFSVDRGQDIAIIYMIEFTGISPASDFCTDCIAGTFSGPGSFDCTPCPANTVSGRSSATCISCSPEYFSYPGSPGCSLRPPCKNDSMTFEFTQCLPETVTRTKYWKWVEPKICSNTLPDSARLPANETGIPCARCNPGTSRSRNGDTNCYPCTNGHSTNATDTPTGKCSLCPKGTYSSPAILLDSIWQYPNGYSSWCTGDCSSEAWRLFEDHIDSGSDHGSRVQSYFRIPINVNSSLATVWFSYRLECDGLCSLELYDNSNSLFSSWGSSILTGNKTYLNAGPFQLSTVGLHNLTFGFNKVVSQRNTDKAIIKMLRIVGIQEGTGTSECLPCSPGFTSQDGSSSCEPCGPGKYAPNITTCMPCPENTYSNKVYNQQCFPCGHDTFTPAGSSVCSHNDCTYQPPNSSYVYNLKSLSRTDTMWGPVLDPLTQAPRDDHYYYLNLCQLEVTQPLCFSLNGDDGSGQVGRGLGAAENDTVTPMSVFGCQRYINNRASISLGHIMGYYPHPEGLGKGLIVEITGGAEGCGSSGNPNIPRSFRITITCDPTAGIGEPVPPASSHIYNGSVYPDVCKYQFVWRSVYGCPICTTEDYEQVIGPCTNGKQVKRYVWKTNPKVCSGGVSLPPTEYLECTTSVVCSVGTYIAADSKCTECPDGEFSLGTGEVFTNWVSPLSTPFSSYCVTSGNDIFRGSPRTCDYLWNVARNSLVSSPDFSKSTSAISVLRMEKNFGYGTEFSLEFQYYVTGTGGVAKLYIDNELKQTISDTTPGYHTLKITVPIGSHVFYWTFSRGDTATSGSTSLYIQWIKTRGTVSAVDSCYKCGIQEVSTNDKSGCRSCPVNTFVSSSSQCAPCSPDTYRLVGQPLNSSSSCVPRIDCTIDDFVDTISDIDSVRCKTDQIVPIQVSTTSYNLQPQICKGRKPNTTTPTMCIPCPTGTIYNGTCAPCHHAQVLQIDKSGAKSCRPITQLYGAVRQVSFFFSKGDTTSEILSALSTTCSGSCSSSGWRMRTDSMDSGIHYGEVVVPLFLDVKTEEFSYLTPNVTFSLQVLALSQLSGGISDTTNIHASVEFYIDGVLQTLPELSSGTITSGTTVRPTFKIPRSQKQDHRLTWVYLQHPGGVPSHVILNNITLFGTALGGIVGEYPCPPGTSAIFTSPDPDVPQQCVPCVAGTFAADFSSSCTPCPEGTISRAGARRCVQCGYGSTEAENSCTTTCKFSSLLEGAESSGDEDIFDLSPLASQYTYTVTPGSDSSISSLYQLNPCLTITPEGCDSPNSLCKSAHVFVEFNNSNPATVGALLHLVPDPSYALAIKKTSTLDAIHTFDLVFTTSESDGDDIPSQCKGGNTTTTIAFYCSLASGQGFPSLQQVSDPCAPVIFWSTAFACPKCTPADVTKSWSACENGLQRSTVVYNRICIDDNAGYLESPKACQDVTISIAAAVAGGLSVLAILLAGGGIVFYCWYTKRQVEIKYARLKTDMNLDDDDIGTGEDRLHQLPSTQIGLEGESSEDNEDDDRTLYSSEDMKTPHVQLETSESPQ